MPLTREEAKKLVRRMLDCQTCIALWTMYPEDHYDELVHERARLYEQVLTALCAPDAATIVAMRAVEWLSQPGIIGSFCPWCKALCPYHAPDCARQAALAKAEEE